MKPTSVCILFAIVLCTAAVADAIVYVYAPACSLCKSFGANYCVYGTVSSKGISCIGQTRIKSCADCKRFGKRCVESKITECFL
ncbi:uncharacterized protein LOC128273594 [Anopheles cruzii]|uniref:uncharacterized protein LOC128273594 n=1 Tax=Anopheles cruzii TaxID=68878 RepID=UPI0022EC8DE2|nr:uncharacterized protein LOC128273594 [Anopheles cruzii]